jgi:hypothetical protein
VVCGPVDEFVIEFDPIFAKKVNYQVKKAPGNIRRYWRNKDKAKERRKAYYAVPEHKARSKELRQKWVKENPERLKETRRRYYQENSEAILTRQKIWHSTNKEKDNAWARAYYLKNAERIKARTKEYRRTHGDPRKRQSQPDGSHDGTQGPAEASGARGDVAPVGAVHVC